MLTAFHAPHLMILDEPTNHLDVDSRELLIQALNAYDGAVLLISHDRHLIDATADRLWLVENGQVKVFDGDMAAYREQLLKSRSGRGARGNSMSDAEPENGGGGGAAVSRQDQRRLAAEKRAQLAPLKAKVDAAEKALEAEQKRLARLDEALADPDIYLNEKEKAQTLMLERGQLAKRIDALEEAWLQAAEAHEKAAGDVV